MRASFGSSFDPRSLVRWLVLAVLGVLLFVVVVPGCGRTSLEPEVLDAGLTPGVCGPSTCPEGCCDASGVCRTGADLRACGSLGGSCSDCVANGFTLCTTSGVCGKDDPTCSSRTCTGCCAVDDGRLRCLSGTQPSACGRSGAQCADCSATGRACDPTTRVCGSTTCDSTNCPGCCVGDQCLPGQGESACGAKGQQCTTCAAGQTCVDAVGGGGSCQGTTTCGPDNCAGCCDAAGKCVTGSDTTACGQNGQKCAACGTFEVCTQEATGRACRPIDTCGPQNCAGCCVGNQCVTVPSPAACGAKGEQCKTCLPSETCGPGGQCVPAGTCNPANCAGCCVGDICAVGSQPTACGVGGVVCQNCSAQGRVCQSGSCQQPACGPATCPNGCCSGNTCVVGTQNNACGKVGGGACQNCTATGQVCQNRACVTACGPANCAGCCQPNGTCDPLGNSNTACGQGGAACTNCAITGSFCNGLVTPRRCNNQQTTCPAPYGVCPNGTTMPIIPQTQKACTDANLDTLTVPCANGPNTPACVAAFAALPLACRTCLAPFNFSFDERVGLWACAASQVTPQCRRALGCAADCLEESCDQCTAASESQCRTLVNSPILGQCTTFSSAATCANVALASGLCSQFSYASFGAWMRAVGDQFCGNGP